MKLLLTLLLFTVRLQAQTIVQAESFSKASGVTAVPIDSSIIATTNSYADYSVKIPKTTYYSLTLKVLNQSQGSYINIKTPTGKTILATANLPVSDTWQTITTRAKLSSASKNLRLVFGGQSSLNYFTYQQEGVVTDNVTKADFDNLKTQVTELKSLLELINIKFDKNVLKLDRNKFKMLPDSTITF